ncbi:transcription factor Dp [Histomonas meleagridis]|uniref:transcription factor Dp n=1 Tax=Histomonas meleagridis TaxID=135588 RepID=UPI003559AAE9|nr:transcription factor Dp [Histomonas meleagridis]KAH0797967.1 transcription factor Dp [Histomonas meleagridis]
MGCPDSSFAILYKMSHETVPRSAKPMSLTNMASQVFSILKENGQTTFDEVADKIFETIGEKTMDTTNDQRTLKRRVYDVLNVLCAAGFVNKDKKTITYQKFNTDLKLGTPEQSQIAERIAQKERELVVKTKLLIYYKLLIERNRKTQRPATAVQLSSIFVGFRDVGNGQIQRSLNGHELVIISRSPPLFFSPLDVFEGISFPHRLKVECLRRIPDLSCLESLVFNNLRDKLSLHQAMSFEPSDLQQSIPFETLDMQQDEAQQTE